MRQSEKPRNVALFTYWSLNCKQEEGLPYWLAGDKQGKQHQQERNGRLLVNANKIAEYNAPTNGWVHLKGTTQNTLRLFRCWHFSAPECAVIRLSKENNVANVDMLNAKKRPLNRWCNQIFFFGVEHIRTPHLLPMLSPIPLHLCPACRITERKEEMATKALRVKMN